MYLTVNTRDDT